MPNLRPLDSQQFGNLTVLERRGSMWRQAAWLCRCTCGVEVVVPGDRLVRGKRKSCAVNGHFWRQAAATPHRSEYRAFKSMWGRCTDPKRHNAKSYFKKRIAVCKRWRSFANFFADMGPKPSPEYTLERKNNALGYTPQNCRWATRAEQRRNMTCSVYIACEDEQVLLIDVAAKLGLDANLVRGRLRKGWTVEDALTKPVRKRPDFDWAWRGACQLKFEA